MSHMVDTSDAPAGTATRRIPPLTAVAGALLAACAPGGEAAQEAGPEMTVAERRDLEITAEASGELEPVREVEIKSRASGELVELAVEVGDRVEPGGLLTRVDPRDVENALEQARADHAVAEEQYAIAEAELQRADSLLAASVITQQEHEGRRLDYANARSNLIRAETDLELAELQMEDVTVRAPMAGVVIDREVEEGTVIQGAGQNLSEGNTLMRVADLDLMRVRTLVDETDIGRIEPGMPVSVHVDAYPDRVFEGEVERVEPGPEVESNVVMYPVIVHLENEDGRLKPGMSAEVTVRTDMSRDAVTLPNNAIVSFDEMAVAGGILGVPEERMQFDRSVFAQLRRELAEERGEAAPEAGRGDRADGQPGVVFVETEEEGLEPRPTLIGANDWTNSEILVGLEEGERVAIIGGAQLRAQQEERMEGMRSRMRGALPF